MHDQAELLSFIIYTDMDGTLLDHDTYSFAPARCVLKKLKQTNIPVIPNTSKTKAELAQMREEMALDTPFIIENGAAVYVPVDYFEKQPPDTEMQNGYWVKEFARPRSFWLEQLNTMKPEFNGLLKHFDAMTIAEIQSATGLSEQNSQLAKQREYGEPILWLGDEAAKQHFIQKLKEVGAEPIQGGRFLHLSGATDKGQAMNWLTNQYRTANNEQQLKTIALGDGQNDVAMLEAADIAVRITSPANSLPQLSKTSNVFTSRAHGPQGWAKSIEHLVFSQHK